MKSLENFGVFEMSMIDCSIIDGGRIPSLFDGAMYHSAVIAHVAKDFISGALDRFNLYR